MSRITKIQSVIKQSNLELPHQHSAVYSELNIDRDQIRVLEIHAGLGPQDLRCTLRCVCLNEGLQTPYETISYVWGDKSQREALYVNNVRIEAPVSSTRVLRRMRRPHQPRVVWIDSICINQIDLKERSQQVGKMGSIYSKATCNLIWLGEEDRDTSSAMRSIATISTDIELAAKDSESLRTLLCPCHLSPRPSNAAGGVGPRISARNHSVEVDQRALQNFFSSVWFSRLWVCQEAALSVESICHKGDFECNLRDVLRAVLWIRYKQRSLPLAWHACSERAADLADWADRDIGFFSTIYGPAISSGLALASLLWSLRNFEVDDPRDRVYAVIGLCESYSQRQTRIVPNYHTDTADALRRATRFIVADDGDLRILQDISHRLDDDDDSTFTTWVPRYDWKRDNSREPYRLITTGRNADGGERMASIQNHELSELLIVRGLHLDTVRYRSATPRETDSAAVILDFLTHVEQLTALTVEDAPQATRSKIAEVLRGGRLVANPDAGDDGDIYTEFRRFLVQQADRSTPGMAKGEVGDKGVDAFRTAFTLTCHARCFFRTDSGYLGVGPHNVQADDVVAIVYGFSLPLILRRATISAGEFRLVGPAYVHGVMNGEAVRRNKACKREPLEFRIR